MSKMNQYDCIIVGGGLAGSLLFYGLKSIHPAAKILLIEKNSTLAGNHTWCFHEADISWSKHQWIRDLISRSWDQYEVIFPRYQRTLRSAYHAIQSEKLHQFLSTRYSDSILLNLEILSLSKNQVELSSGQVIHAPCVVDARGWREISGPVCGYQKFVGLDLKLKKPHALEGVRLKDVTVKQIDGYRFVYVLPWSSDQILIEDTYYSNSSQLDVKEIKQRILAYAQKENWEVEEVLREESGCLPLVSSTQKVEDEGPVVLGARSGEYQPVTGYTFPQTFQRIEELLLQQEFDTELWKKKLWSVGQQDKRQRFYFHFLNKMLFYAADPDNRYKVLERFYRLPQGLIERFYRGKLSVGDQLRILIGKPPVPIGKAIKSILRS